MQLLRIVLVSVLFVATGVGDASAQEAGSIGITMGYPSQVGVLWQVTDRIALRPEVTLSRTSIETTITSPLGATIGESDGWSVGVGLSALLRLQQWDDVRTYVSPRFEYTRTSSTLSVVRGPSSTTGSGYGAGGAFGVQYSPARHFGVFGEVGIHYSHAENTQLNSTTSGYTLSTRSGAGVILFF
jgi:hypothetical protein